MDKMEAARRYVEAMGQDGWIAQRAVLRRLTKEVIEFEMAEGRLDRGAFQDAMAKAVSNGFIPVGTKETASGLTNVMAAAALKAWVPYWLGVGQDSGGTPIASRQWAAMFEGSLGRADMWSDKAVMVRRSFVESEGNTPAELLKRVKAMLGGEAATSEPEAQADGEVELLELKETRHEAILNFTLEQAGIQVSIKDMLAEINEARQRPPQIYMPAAMPPAAAVGAEPAGDVEYVDAATVFPDVKAVKGISVPKWTWDGAHPRVPVVDDGYIFQAEPLHAVLYALSRDKRMYLQGHTGTGKTTLLMQVAARLNYPVMRVNFDSEISRFDLIGRDVLLEENGKTVSRFVEGVLPKMLSGPNMAILDEIDFVRPDVAYVLQSALEGEGMTLLEDGGRVVRQHPGCRIFATGNTVGQGDEHGLYQGARPQSAAFLDRFTVWSQVGYLPQEHAEKLIKSKVPMASQALCAEVAKYATEHQQAMMRGDLGIPLSPRGMLAIAEYATAMVERNKKVAEHHALRCALQASVLDRANEADRATIKGLMDRL